MSDVRSPRTGPVPPGAGMPFAMLGIGWGAVALVGLVWATGTGLEWLATGNWAPPQFGFEFPGRLIGDGIETIWPGIDPTVLGTVVLIEIVVLGIAIGVPIARFVDRRGRAGDAARHMATARDLQHMTRTGATTRARQLRPALAESRGRDVPDGQAGVVLGEHQPSGERLWASREDVCLSVMAPRAGKTTALAIPAVLDAPGAVVATSNKGDLWAATATLRAEQGRVWTFDPQGIVGAQQTWWFDPLAAVTGVASAHRLAGHFVQEVRGSTAGLGGTGQDFWTSAAADLLTSLLLAAAADRRPITEVYTWLSDSTSPVAAGVLRRRGHTVIADGLASRQAGAAETRDGIFETARTAAQCLRDPQIAAWVTPPAERALPALDVTGVADSTDTLYLHSKDGAGAAAPLVAALVDQVLRAATVTAERCGGRLDPPLVAVLDEAANICRIGDLPELYSHFGSRGIVPVTILQSYRQGTRVWGEPGMAALWSAATVKVIGSGIDDPKLADDLSRLVGERDVTIRSDSYGRGDRSTSLSVRRERILPPEKIRALPRGTALLLATGTPVAMIQLQPWFAGPRADEISAAIAATQHQEIDA